VAHYIFDNVTFVRKAALLQQMPKRSVSALTLHQLAQRIGAAPDELAASVAEWNAFLASDGEKEAEFGRVVLPEERRPIVEGPFHAVEMVIGSNFVAGGMRVSTAMQVVDVFGEAIPGLYAAGDSVGGLNPTAELGGMRLAGGFTLGRIAGVAAAENRSGEISGPALQGAFLPSMLSTRIALADIRE